MPDVTLEWLSRLPFRVMDQVSEGSQTTSSPSLPFFLSLTSFWVRPGGYSDLSQGRQRSCFRGTHILVRETDYRGKDKNISQDGQSAEETKTEHRDKE